MHVNDLARRAARATEATVEITAIVRHTTQRAIALFDGATREIVDESTGEVTTREELTWLPRRFVTRPSPKRGEPETIVMPEWLARQRGLM